MATSAVALELGQQVAAPARSCFELVGDHHTFSRRGRISAASTKSLHITSPDNGPSPPTAKGAVGHERRPAQDRVVAQ